MTPIIDELPVFALVAAVLVIAVVAAERDPASAPVCPAGPLEGGITHIIDGDTIIVDDRVRLRLEGIAAPELHEPGGQASREVLAMIAVHTPLRCSLTGAASHERCVGSCADDQGRDLGWLLVSAGAALDCPAYSGGRYAQAERAASMAGLPLVGQYLRPPYCY